MALAFRDALGSNNAGGATNITMTVPTGVVDGDLMIMAVACRGGNLPFPVTGWTQLDTNYNGSNMSTAIYWRVASSEPASYSVSWNASTVKASGVIIAFSGADTGTTPAWIRGTSQTSATWGQNTTTSSFASQTIASVLIVSGPAGTTYSADSSFGPNAPEPAAQAASTGGSAATRTTTIGLYRIDAAQTISKVGFFTVGTSVLYTTYSLAVFEAVTGPSPQTISPSAIGSAEAFDTQVVKAGPVSVVPSAEIGRAHV